MPAALSLEEFDSRITFHDDDEIMEVSFENLRLSDSAEVNRFYDRVEERIAGSGHSQWFFLVNYCDTRIDPGAWVAFSQRGKEVNLAHSMGTVRFNASEATLRQIKNAGARENFDANLFYDRTSAMDHLKGMPSTREVQAPPKIISFQSNELDKRVEFRLAEDIMFVDFSDMSFEHSADVDFVYDHIERHITPMGRKWYFLVNYNGTRIQSPAWVQYAARGKRLNEEWSLGSVRFAAGSETEAEIRMRAESQDFRPNIRNTEQEAVERIAEMKAEAAAG